MLQYSSSYFLTRINIDLIYGVELWYFQFTAVIHGFMDPVYS